MQEIDAIWRPIPNSSQELALDSRCHHTLYTGARGPGKTDTQLMRFRRHVGKGYGPFWIGVIFDVEYKNLDDLIGKSKRWFNRFDDGAKFLGSTSALKWVWPTGEELRFRSIRRESDYWDYHGQEYPYIGWNELCKYKTLMLYFMLMSCNRSSYMPEKDGFIGGQFDKVRGIPVDENGNIPPPIPLEVFSTTNPYGVGHTAVKQHFIDVAPYGQVVRTTVDVFNPQTQQREPVTKTQVTIFGTYKENIYLDPAYIAELERQTDENLRKAWLYGDWDIVAGGAVSDVWRKGIHDIPRFRIPSGWLVDRALDWGSSTPFAVGWFTEANGEEAILEDGTSFCPPPGTLIQIDELYGSKKIGTNLGLKMSAPDLADAIINREIHLMNERWVPSQPWPGPADNQIRDVREIDVDTIEKKMADKGVRWDQSDKSQGSRKIGLQLIRDRLEASAKKEGPGLYFMRNCLASISTIPSLPRDEKHVDDVDTESEDHAYDMVRYRVLKGSNRYARKIKVGLPH